MSKELSTPSDKRFIPVCKPVLLGKERTYVEEALSSGWISSAGRYLEEFEKKFAQFVDCKYAVACSNGTAAVYIALQAVGIKPGDRIVVPSFTMMASVFPILMLGAEVVFVDSEEDTWCLDPKALDAVQGEVKAIMPVHIYGHPCDMDPIRAWAKKRGALVIEDAAEAHGALYKQAPCGSLSDISAFSLFANKVITCGEGGIVTTSSEEYADKLKYYRNLCFDKDPKKRFIHKEVGFNFRLTNLQAAIALAQVEEAERLVNMRRGMAQLHLKHLAPLQDYLQLPCEKEWAKNCYWMFGVVLKNKCLFSVETVLEKLHTKGIETRRFFYPGHLQPLFEGKYADLKLPVSEKLWDRGFYLPSSSDLTEDEAAYIATSLAEVLRV